jgi:hypothetical protein
MSKDAFQHIKDLPLTSQHIDLPERELSRIVLLSEDRLYVASN